MSRWAVSVPARSPTVSINLSPRQLKDPQLLERISEVLIRNQIAPGRLRLEITENAIHEDTGFVLDLLKRLVESGVSLALDNFGSGLASLTSLVRLPLDLVKVDRRLTAYLPTPGRQAAILQTIFDLGRLLEVRILAEGIERPEQLAVLPRYGCDLVQGHLFSPAVEKDAAESLLRRGHWQSELNNLAENRPPKRGLA
jgi:EAL domain-containing protein (putative c-di-GMP-specific phosphodiesterase class I)